MSDHPAAHPDFWRQRWQANQIGFHEGAANQHLVRFWPTLGLAPGSRVLVPLSGKSADLAWLAEQGHRVVGVELSPIACEAFFAERGVTPERSESGPFAVWSAGPITLFQGDLFAFDQPGTFDAIWDRAAFVALPPPIRPRYAAHTRAQLKKGGALLIVTFSYDSTRRDGPPFSIPEAEVHAAYAGAELLHRVETDEPRWLEIGGLTESVWRLRA